MRAASARRWGLLAGALLSALLAGAGLLWAAQTAPEGEPARRAPLQQSLQERARPERPEPSRAEAAPAAPPAPAPPTPDSELFSEASSEAEQRMHALEPRYRSQLAHLGLPPERVLDTAVLGRLIAEQSALVRELQAVAELADPAQTDRALRQAAELEEAFASWLVLVSEAAGDEALSQQLDALAELHYSSAEKGFTLAEELSPSEP